MNLFDDDEEIFVEEMERIELFNGEVMIGQIQASELGFSINNRLGIRWEGLLAEIVCPFLFQFGYEKVFFLHPYKNEWYKSGHPKNEDFSENLRYIRRWVNRYIKTAKYLGGKKDFKRRHIYIEQKKYNS